MRKKLTVGAVVVGGLVLGLAAQGARQTFDVVSIKKRSEPLNDPRLARNVIREGLFRMPDATVAALVQYAWEISHFRVVEGPDWMWRDGFEVEARAAGDAPSTAQVRLMVRSMLEDRFGLAVHWEEREMDYLALVPARTDKRLGPYLQPQDDCDNPATRMSRPSPEGGGSRTWGCGPLSDVAMFASRSVGMPVIDATGLDGTFDYYWFVPYEATPPQGDEVISLQPRTLQPSLVSAAIEKDLGLTLKATQGPVDVLVIDSVQQPTEN